VIRVSAALSIGSSTFVPPAAFSLIAPDRPDEYPEEET
jgi:hypothetical protein